MGKRGPEKQYPARLAVVTTHEQLDDLRQAAKAVGETMSEYIRRELDRAMDRERPGEEN